VIGRIGVSVSGADSNRVYAMIEADKGGLYRSDDGGDHWERVNDDERYRQRAWYFSHVFADPKSADTVYYSTPGCSAPPTTARRSRYSQPRMVTSCVMD